MLLSRRRRVGIAAIALGVLMAVGACGGGSESSTSKPKRSRSSTYSFVGRDRVEVSGRDGALSLTLTAPALWFNGSQSVLAFKPVSGDFKVTATVRTQRASNDEPPPPAIRLGGLMARDPASDSTGMQNYVHIVVGNGPSGVLAVEHKTTTNSNSVYDAPEWPSPDAQLRICRVGSTFNLYKRPVGSRTWEQAASYDRPDLPAELQVGADIYSPNTPPDLRARWDEVRYQPVADVGDCESDR
jgi:hypothetical protein